MIMSFILSVFAPVERSTISRSSFDWRSPSQDHPCSDPRGPAPHLVAARCWSDHLSTSAISAEPSMVVIVASREISIVPGMSPCQPGSISNLGRSTALDSRSDAVFAAQQSSQGLQTVDRRMQRAQHPDNCKNHRRQNDFDHTVARKPTKHLELRLTSRPQGKPRHQPEPIRCGDQQHYGKQRDFQDQELPVEGDDQCVPGTDQNPSVDDACRKNHNNNGKTHGRKALCSVPCE